MIRIMLSKSLLS